MQKSNLKNTRTTLSSQKPSAGKCTGNKLAHDEWASLISEWKSSNLTQKNFCASRGINLHTFIYHCSKSKKTPTAQKKMVPIKVHAALHAKAMPSQCFIVELRDGVKLAIPQDYNPSALKGLLSMLESCL